MARENAPEAAPLAMLGRAPIRRCAGVLVLVAAACGPDPEPARPRVYQQLGSTHATPPDTSPPDTRPAAIAELQRLADATAQLSAGGDRSHADIVGALRELADAAEQFAPDRRAELAAIERAAAALSQSPPDDTDHEEITRYGLDAAVGLFAAARPWRPERNDEYARAVCLLGRAVDEVDDDEPLLAQQDHVIAAFRAATAALYLGMGIDPPPGMLDDAPCRVEVRSVS